MSFIVFMFLHPGLILKSYLITHVACLVTIQNQRRTGCAGVFNASSGQWKNDVGNLQKYVVIVDSDKRNYKYSTFVGLPSIVATDCTSVGVVVDLDGGLVCRCCSDLRAKKGNINPASFLRTWANPLRRCLDRRARETLTPSDIEEATSFRQNNGRRLTKEGKDLLEEATAQAAYGTRMAKLAQRIPSKKFKLAGGAVPSPSNFLHSASQLYEENEEFRGSILVSLMEALVCKHTTGRSNPKIEERVKNFYRWLDALSPIACDGVAVNLGSAPSKRWMQVLNARDRAGTSCTYDETGMASRIRRAIKIRQLDNCRISYSLAIDATKVSEVIDISSSHRAIMGGAYPDHMVSTLDKDKDTIHKIVKQEPGCSVKLVKATEVKVAFIVFQQVPSGLPPVEIIALRPQSNNESSDFTNVVVQAAATIAEETPNGSLLSFAVDGVSVESKDVMTANCKFLDGLSKHTGVVDNKHNAKNDRYAKIGGSSTPSIGELVVDTDILRQAGVPIELWRVKDFAGILQDDEKVGYCYP